MREKHPPFDKRLNPTDFHPHETSKSANQFLPHYSVATRDLRLPLHLRSFPVRATLSRGPIEPEPFPAGTTGDPECPTALDYTSRTIYQFLDKARKNARHGNIETGFVYARPRSARNESDFATLLSSRCHALFGRLIVI